MPAVYYAVKARDHALLVHELASGHDANEPFTDERGVSCTALELLVSYPGCPTGPGMMKTLLENGANTEAWNRQGATPLINIICPIAEAERIHKFEMVVQLLDHGADVNASTKSGPYVRRGRCALHRACLVDWTNMVQLLIYRGAYVDSHHASNGLMTPLHVAVTYGREDSARILIQHGASLHAKTITGYTPSDIAYYVASASTLEFAAELDDMMEEADRIARCDVLAIGYDSYIRNKDRTVGPTIWGIGRDPLRMVMDRLHKEFD